MTPRTPHTSSRPAQRTYFDSRIAPEAPSPSGARALIDEQTEHALRAVAGQAMAAGDAPIITWVLDKCIGPELLGRYWREGEILAVDDGARLAEWLADQERPYEVGPREILVIGALLAGIAADPACIREAHAAAAGRVYAAAMRSWADILARHPNLAIGETVIWANPAMHHEVPEDGRAEIARADHQEITRLREMVPEACPLAGDLYDALEDLQVTVEFQAAMLRRGEWLPIDRHLVSEDWCIQQMRAMHRVVTDAVTECADDPALITARLARLLELLGHVHLAEQLLEDPRAARSMGALLSACAAAPGADQNIYGLMCALEELGAWGVIAGEYGARLPGALSRRDAHDDTRSARLGLRAAGGVSLWLGDVEAMLQRDAARDREDLYPEVQAALEPPELHAVSVVDVTQIESFLSWAASDDAFLGWGMHFEPVRILMDVVRPCLVFSVGAMIDGRFASASAVFPLPGEVANPTTIHDARVAMDEALARAGVSGLRDVVLHPRPEGSILDADWRCVRPERPVTRPSVRALLGVPECDHRAGEWSMPRSGMPHWAPEAVPADALALSCEECAGPVTDVIPLHQIAEHGAPRPIGDPEAYLARENFYRAVRGETPAVSLAELQREDQLWVLTPQGAVRLMREEDVVPGGVCDLSAALFG